MAAFVVCPLWLNAYAGDVEAEEGENYPKFIATLYNGGKVADVVEAESFDYEKVSRITFRGMNGKKIHIIDGRIVIRETDQEDFAALKEQRQKTAKLRQLLALKRQQRAIQEELDKQTQLAQELKEIDESESDSEVAKKNTDNGGIVEEKIEYGEEEE
jgi:hypothetical protein